MTQEEIIDGNKLIAELMGGELFLPKWLSNEGGTDLYYQIPKGSEGFHVELPNHLKYHSSWDWLMPAWEKFRDTAKVETSLHGILTNYIADCAQRMAFGGIEKFYPKFVSALKWYNTQKK